MTDDLPPGVSFRADTEAMAAEAVDCIETTVDAADADGVVVGLSGGLDSTTTATLAVEALGSERVYGLVLPSSKLGSKSAQDAETVADVLGIDHETIHLQPLLACFGDMVPGPVDLHGDPVVRGNLVARLRMSMLYLTANAMERLVVGTTNRSERLLGYFTKHGDGAADVLPLAHLYKTEVERLADALEVPPFIAEKPPTAGFYPGQSDRADFGAPYTTVDAVLKRLVEDDRTTDAIRSELGVDAAVVDRVKRHHEQTAHKRQWPPRPPVR